MRDKPATGVVPSPAVFINAQSAITGLRGRDLLSTLRSVAAHGLRNPVHSAKHALKLGGQLGRVLLGETLHPTNPNDSRFADPAWRKWPFCLWQQSFLLTQQWWDAATHAGSFDIGYMGALPGMVLMAAADEADLAAMIANLTETHLVINLTSTDGLYDRSPASGRKARLIPLVE